jgi:hypothetical protein
VAWRLGVVFKLGVVVVMLSFVVGDTMSFEPCVTVVVVAVVVVTW